MNMIKRKKWKEKIVSMNWGNKDAKNKTSIF